jgi:hypothetical protein
MEKRKVKIVRGPFPQDKRKYPRRAAMKNVRTDKGSPSNDEFIIDICGGGCCIRTTACYNVGDRIIMYIDEKQLVGKVIWKQNDDLGVRFLKCQLR